MMTKMLRMISGLFLWRFRRTVNPMRDADVATAVKHVGHVGIITARRDAVNDLAFIGVDHYSVIGFSGALGV